MPYQIVPPDIYFWDAAEISVQTFKDHFIAGICSIDTKILPKNGNRLLPHITTTLNMLHTSRNNPKLSAYAAIFGIHDFNQLPLATPVIKVIVHENNYNCRSWSPYGTDGWYIGPYMEHYHRVKCYILENSSAWNVDALIFFLPLFHYQKWIQKITYYNQLETY